jgi:hypothetical protein
MILRKVIGHCALAAVLLAGGCMCKECGQKAETGGKATGDKIKIPPTQQGQVTKLGRALTGAQEVTVEDLLKNPEGYKDKTVRVSGKVDDLCKHRGAWFAVSSRDGKKMVRVMTMPAFQVSPDNLGKDAVAEGKVEVITVTPEEIQHFSMNHKFIGEVKNPGASISLPVIRAFGAELK